MNSRPLTNWLTTNKLTLNINKTHYMVFHRAKIKTKIKSITFLNELLISVKSARFLGVILDHSLTWIDHIQYVQNKRANSNYLQHYSCSTNERFTLLFHQYKMQRGGSKEVKISNHSLETIE